MMLATAMLGFLLFNAGTWTGEDAKGRPGETAGLQECVLDTAIERRVNIRYLLYLPDGYSRDNGPWPAILYLHGGLGRGDDFGKMSWYPLPRLLGEPGRKLPFVVIMPQCPLDDYWGDTEGLIALLDEVLSAHAIDRDRIYLAGYSMGGTAAWRLASVHPELFAAIAPMSGCANPYWAPRLKDVPAWVFHGGKDTTVPLSESEVMVKALEAEGADVRFSLDPERGHSPPGDEDHMRLFEWFLTHRRAMHGRTP